jgi:DNA-binding NarL/FixJ family response regulator
VKAAQLRLHIRQLCCLGLPAEQLMPALLRAVRQFVGAESAGFFWVNSAGDMTNLYAERVLPADAMRLYFERYYDSGDLSFRRAFTERAGQHEQVTSSSASLDVERSKYYAEVLRHLEAHHIMYGIVRAQGQAVGQLSLYRPKSSAPFSAEEHSNLNSIVRYVAHAVSHREPEGTVREFLDSDNDAVLLVDAQGNVRQQSAAARKLLLLATQTSSEHHEVMTAAIGSMQPELQRLVGRLRSVFSGRDVSPPTLLVDNQWGRFVLRAYSMSEEPGARDALIAIRIQHQEPMLVRFVGALNSLDLSPQQREVAVGLAKGASNRELAVAMGVSVNTVGYHVKQLFLKLDAHDRQRLITKVLADAGGHA